MWNNTDSPLAYFISFRTYGTWLHGDERGSIDRFHNRYRSPYIPPDKSWRTYNEQQLKTKPLILKARERSSIKEAIRETCEIRKWSLLAHNVRTNHVHSVVSANRKPGLVLNAFKANATRRLREGWSLGLPIQSLGRQRQQAVVVERTERCQCYRLCAVWTGQ